MWTRRLAGVLAAADNHNRELRNHCRKGSKGGEDRSQDHADGSDSHGNFEKCVSVLVFNDDPLDVPFVDQLANLIHQVAA